MMLFSLILKKWREANQLSLENTKPLENHPPISPTNIILPKEEEVVPNGTILPPIKPTKTSIATNLSEEVLYQIFFFYEKEYKSLLQKFPENIQQLPEKLAPEPIQPESIAKQETSNTANKPTPITPILKPESIPEPISKPEPIFKSEPVVKLEPSLKPEPIRIDPKPVQRYEKDNHRPYPNNVVKQTVGRNSYNNSRDRDSRNTKEPQSPTVKIPSKDFTPIISREKDNKEISKEVVKELPKEILKELPKEVSKELPKEASKELPKEVSKEVAKELPKEILKEVIKEVVKELPKEILKELPKEVSKELPKEIPLVQNPELPPKEAIEPMRETGKCPSGSEDSFSNFWEGIDLIPNTKPNIEHVSEIKVERKLVEPQLPTRFMPTVSQTVPNDPVWEREVHNFTKGLFEEQTVKETKPINENKTVETIAKPIDKPIAKPERYNNRVDRNTPKLEKSKEEPILSIPNTKEESNKSPESFRENSENAQDWTREEPHVTTTNEPTAEEDDACWTIDSLIKSMQNSKPRMDDFDRNGYQKNKRRNNNNNSRRPEFDRENRETPPSNLQNKNGRDKNQDKKRYKWV